MKKLKKWTTLLAVAAFVMLVIPQWTLSVSATEASDGARNGNIASGTAGTLTWVIDANGKLTISGSGDFSNVGQYNRTMPWDSYKNDIKSAVCNVTGMTDASNLFAGCSNMKNVDLSNFNTSNVTEMRSMFKNCSSLTGLDVTNFDTSKVKGMDGMFLGCSSLTSLDVTNFDTSNAIRMQGMFSGCSSLTSLDVTNFDTSNALNMSGMFSDCSSLTSLDVSNFNTSKVTDILNMFENCSSLISLDLSNFDTSNVINIGFMFGGCNNLINLNISNFNISKVVSLAGMFQNCSSLTSLDLSSFDTSNVDSMSGMFYRCSSLTSLDLSNFDTSNVDSMESMFTYCSSLTSLDLSKFDTSKVEHMEAMFLGCSSLTNLSMSSFDTSKVIYAYAMFEDCSSLTSLNLSNFDMSLVESANSMFEECNKLSIIYTPYNLKDSVLLPGRGWKLPDGTEITELPKNLNSSVMITRSLPGADKDDNKDDNSNGADKDNNNQPGAISGVLEGTGSTTDSATYGTRLLAANPTDYKTIMLSWDAVPNAKSYEIFYSTSPDTGFKRLANAKKTSYKFTKAKCGVTYYFQMRVCQKGKVKSEFGPISYGKTDLSSSAALQVKKTTYNSVTLKWSKVAGAKRYEIYYADSMDGDWQSLGVKGGTSFTHKKLVTGATYYYQIRPIRDSFQGGWSNGVSATTILGNVSNLKVKATGMDQMKVTWRKVKGATQYVIKRSDRIDGDYEVIGYSGKASYWDTGLKSGTTYFYKVSAVSGPYRTKDTDPVGQTTKIPKK